MAAAVVIVAGAMTLLCTCGATQATTPPAEPCSLRMLQQTNRPTHKVLQGGTEHTRRRVWLSLFDAVNASNPRCELGSLGQMMTSILVDETGDECVSSPILAAFTKRNYYSLKLSSDGDIVQHWRANCDKTCTSCQYASEQVVLDDCLPEHDTNNNYYSVAFASASSHGTCVGPYITNSENRTTLTAIESVQFPVPGCIGTANCSEVAMVFGFSFGATDQKCHRSSVFGVFNVSYSLETDNNRTFTMKWCNGTQCEHKGGTCAELFTKLPLGVCRDNSWGSMHGGVELVETQELVTCKRSSASFSPTILLAVFGSVGALALMVIGVKQITRRGNYSRAGYARINS